MTRFLVAYLDVMFFTFHIMVNNIMPFFSLCLNDDTQNCNQN